LGRRRGISLLRLLRVSPLSAVLITVVRLLLLAVAVLLVPLAVWLLVILRRLLLIEVLLGAHGGLDLVATAAGDVFVSFK